MSKYGRNASGTSQRQELRWSLPHHLAVEDDQRENRGTVNGSSRRT